MGVTELRPELPERALNIIKIPSHIHMESLCKVHQDTVIPTYWAYPLIKYPNIKNDYSISGLHIARNFNEGCTLIY